MPLYYSPQAALSMTGVRMFSTWRGMHSLSARFFLYSAQNGQFERIFPRLPRLFPAPLREIAEIQHKTLDKGRGVMV